MVAIEEKKENAFKKYRNVISLFYKIISKADSHYSEMDCEKIMKNIIKNARRRFELSKSGTWKRSRASSGKRRPHNLNYKKTKKKNEENDESDELADQIELIVDETDNEETADEWWTWRFVS